jgi:hypothetical protein
MADDFDFGGAMVLLFCGLVLGIVIMGVAFNYNMGHAVYNDGKIRLQDLSKDQVKTINLYLQTNYPDQYLTTSEEPKTTIIYVAQNVTQGYGCK